MLSVSMCYLASYSMHLLLLTREVCGLVPITITTDLLMPKEGQPSLSDKSPP